MPYNREAFRQVKAEFEKKRLAAITGAESRTQELYSRIDGLEAVDRELAKLGPRILTAAAAADSPEKGEAAVDKIRSETEAVSGARRRLLTKHGYPSDYDAVKFECAVCSDTGYDGLYMCECMKRALAQASLEMSGIGAKRMAEQSFDSFSLDYYRKNTEALSSMSNNLETAKNYAASFGSAESAGACLLMIGGTGLGKTHLSTAIAREVTAKGNDVMYLSAGALITPFEEERFNSRGISQDDRDSSQRIFECDLLIIDDLGTEMITKFSVSALYNIVNTRLGNGKAMIINTNLSPAELRKNYADRITSRLFGEFRLLLFKGSDVRAQKLSL